MDCRHLHTRQSQEVMLTGDLRVDLFEQSRYLANGISMKLLIFFRQRDEFLLMAAANTFRNSSDRSIFDRMQSKS